MKVLLIQAGVPYNPVIHRSQGHTLRQTLTKGPMEVLDAKFINNTQSREAIAKNGIDVTYYYYTHRRSLLNLIKGALAIRRIAKEGGYDVVNMYWGGLSTLLGVLFCPTRFIITLLGSDLHGSYTKNGRKTLFGGLLSLFSQLTCNHADAVIVMSEKMKEKVWRKNRHKTHVIPEGVDLSKFFPIEKELAREYLQWDDHTPVILFFDNKSKVKNFALAKKAFSILKKSIPDAKLKVVNGIPHHQTIWYYNAADLMLLTSFHEGSNNSIKEAMACGLPVVSVDAGDASSRLRYVHPSFVAENYDADLLAEKMQWILTLGQRSNGMEHTRDFELNNAVSPIIDLYYQVSGKERMQDVSPDVKGTDVRLSVMVDLDQAV